MYAYYNVWIVACFFYKNDTGSVRSYILERISIVAETAHAGQLSDVFA